MVALLLQLPISEFGYMVRIQRNEESFTLKLVGTMNLKLVHHKTDIKLLVICAALFVTASCSNEGNSEGFCRRWTSVMERVKNDEINSSEELLSAVTSAKLGDPGGSLSKFRDSFENEMRYGTSDGAIHYTNLIDDICAYYYE